MDEEPGGLQSMESQSQTWLTNTSTAKSQIEPFRVFGF